MSYKYDVFVSYTHDGILGTWVREVFVPAFRGWMNEGRPDARIFPDDDFRPGTYLAPYLNQTLQRSKCMIAVLNAQYFSSEWCCAEWATMMERERVAQRQTHGQEALIYPIRFYDGDYFHNDAKQRLRKDFYQFNTLLPGHEGSELFLRFSAEVQGLCREIEELIEHAPEWSDSWPVMDKLKRPDKPSIPFPTQRGRVGGQP